MALEKLVTFCGGDGLRFVSDKQNVVYKNDKFRKGCGKEEAGRALEISYGSIGQDLLLKQKIKFWENKDVW